MQLSPVTQNRFGVVNSFDPLYNITAGVAYLDWLLEEFDGDLDRTVAAYNAGENAVRGHGGVLPYSETREHVRRVNSLYRRYRQSSGPDLIAGRGPAVSRTGCTLLAA